jgi:hypothetical protein
MNSNAWSELNKAQRQYLLSHARFKETSVIRAGKVFTRREPVNAEAKALVTAKALDRDFQLARKFNRSGEALIAAYKGPILQCKSGRARGAHELQRKHVLAMPMQYYRHGGTC